MKTYNFKFGVNPEKQYQMNRSLKQINSFINTMVSEAKACTSMQNDVEHFKRTFCEKYGLEYTEDENGTITFTDPSDNQ